MPPVRKVKPAASPKQPKSESPKKNTVVSGQLEKKIKKQQLKKKPQRGVVFVKHLPHGFFEEQLKNYFEQFGKVTRLRLARSRRTGGSKNFAFVEFEYPEVAEVAAETMDNYLMFQKLVKASYIPPEKQMFNYFKTSVRKVQNKAGKDIYVSQKTAAITRKVKQINNWSAENYQKRTSNKLKKFDKLKKKYAHLGIDFSNIVVEPKKINNDDNSSKSESATTDLANKQKTKESTKKTKGKSTKKSKADVELAALLGNTIDDDSDDEDYIEATESDEESNDSESAKTTFANKQKRKENDKGKGKSNKMSKTDLKLEDLLGNTINDDSDDDDYVAAPESGEESTETDDEIGDVSLISAEDTNDFHKSSDDEAEITKPKKSKLAQNVTPYKKSVKVSKVDRYEQLIKRKPHTGGIKKAKKLQKPVPVPEKKVSKSLQMAAVKELLNTIPTTKLSTDSKNKTSKIGKKQKLKK